jgi:hypothetical protein
LMGRPKLVATLTLIIVAFSCQLSAVARAKRTRQVKAPCRRPICINRVG